MFTVLVFITAMLASAQAPPQMPKPAKEHKWLEQFTGDWEFETEALVPGGESIMAQGTERAHMLGGFWLVAEGDSKMMGMKVNTIFTVGYHPGEKKFVGSWVDSCTGHMWKYEGTLDQEGRALALETRGPSPLDPTKQANFREVLELVDKDHKTFTSYFQGEDGNWQKMVITRYTRKK
jgi:hypothetical protein